MDIQSTIRPNLPQIPLLPDLQIEQIRIWMVGISDVLLKIVEATYMDVTGTVEVLDSHRHSSLYASDGDPKGIDVDSAGVANFTSIPIGPANNPTTANQFSRKQYVDDTANSTYTAAVNACLQLSGNQTANGVKTFNEFPITPSNAPTSDYQVSNKKYVDKPFAILQNRQAQNTAGGNATSGSWQTYPLNSEYEDPANFVDSSSLPAFSLAAGTYRIEASCTFVQTDSTQIRLFNVTANAVQNNVNSLAIVGGSIICYNTYWKDSRSHLSGTFTLTETTQMRIEYRCFLSHTGGLGSAANFGAEVYADVKITKLY